MTKSKKGRLRRERKKFIPGDPTITKVPRQKPKSLLLSQVRTFFFSYKPFILGFCSLLLLVWSVTYLMAFSSNKVSLSGQINNELHLKTYLVDTNAKSPICGCFINRATPYGITACSRDFLLESEIDTANFLIIAPDEGTIEDNPGYTFNAELYLFEKNQFLTANIDSLLKKIELDDQSSLIIKKKLTNIPFLNIITTGKIGVKIFGNNTVASFLPIDSSEVSIKKHYSTFDDNVVDSIFISEKYEYLENRKNWKKPGIDFMGSKLVFYTENFVEFLGHRGRHFLGLEIDSTKKQLSKVAIAVVEVPFAARVSVGSWSEWAREIWRQKLMRKLGTQYESYYFFYDIPIMGFKNGAMHVLDTSVLDVDYPAPLPFTNKMFTKLTVINPLNDSNFYKLHNFFSTKKHHWHSFSEESKMLGVRQQEIKIPDSLRKEFSEMMEAYDPQKMSYEEAKKQALHFQEYTEKYLSDNEYSEPQDIKAPPSQMFAYPTLPSSNGLFIGPGFYEMIIPKFKGKYSIGNKYYDCVTPSDLEIKNFKLKDDEKNIFTMPITKTSTEIKDLEFSGTGEIYINGERKGERNYENPLFTALAIICGLVPLLGLIQFNKNSKSR